MPKTSGTLSSREQTRTYCVSTLWAHGWAGTLHELIQGKTGMFASVMKP